MKKMKYVKLFENFDKNFDFEDHQEFTDFVDNVKSGDLVGKEAIIKVTECYLSVDNDNRWEGFITVKFNRLTNPTLGKVLKFDATLIDDGGCEFLSVLRNKEISIVIFYGKEQGTRYGISDGKVKAKMSEPINGFIKSEDDEFLEQFKKRQRSTGKEYITEGVCSFSVKSIEIIN